jgi:hypothetical protein
VYSPTTDLYYFSSAIDALIQSSNYAIFTAREYNGGSLLYDVGLQRYVHARITTGGVAFAPAPKSIAPPSQPPDSGINTRLYTFNFSSPVVLWPEAQFMVTTYQITSASGFNLYTSLSAALFIPHPLTSVQFLPTNLYYNQECTLSSSPGTSILSYVCPDDTILSCVNRNVPQASWTTAELCRQGIVFPYCVRDERCGDSNCNGPCSGGSEAMENVCHPSGGTYTCSVEPVPPEEVPWWRSAWFIWSCIGLAVFIGILVMLVVILLVIRHNQNKRDEQEASDREEERRFNRLYSQLSQ